MDKDIKELLLEVAQAINAGLAGSGPLSDRIRRLEKHGYRFAVYLEATVLISEPERAPITGPASKPARRRRARGGLLLSEKDRHFLKSLKIAIQAKDPA